MAEVIKTVLTAENAEHVKAFEEAAAAVRGYSGKLEAARRASSAAAMQELRALQMEVSGQQEAATALRENLRLRQDALKLARKTGMSEQQAQSMVRRRIQLEKELAAQRARTQSLGLGGIAGGGDLLKEDSARFMQQHLAGQQQQLRKSVRGSAAGLMELAHAAQDAQYGFRGIQNNIPGLLVGLGAKTGVAAVVALAAAGVYGLAKAWGALDEKITSTKAFEKQRDAISASTKEQQKAIKAAREQLELAQEMDRHRRDLAGATGSTLNIQSGAVEVAEGQIAERRRQAELANELREAQAQLQEALGQPAVEPTSRKREIESLSADLEDRNRAIAGAEQELARLRTEAENSARAYSTRQAKNAEDLAEVQKRLAEATTAVAGEKAFIESSGGSGSAVWQSKQNLRIYEERQADLTRQEQVLQAAAEVLKSEQARAEALAKQSIQTLDEKVAAQWEEVRSTKELITQREQLLDLERQTARLKADHAERTQLAEAGRGGFFEEWKSWVGYAEQVSEAARKGREQLEESRREKEQFLELLREQKKLQKELEGLPGGGAREPGSQNTRGDGGWRRTGAIRQYDGDVGLSRGAFLENTSGAYLRNTQGAFLNSELQRRGRERAGRTRDPVQAMVRELRTDRLVEVNEELLAIWKNLQKR